MSGWHAGQTAARESLEADHAPLSLDVVHGLRERAMAPLQRAAGNASSDTLHDALARLEASVVRSMILSEARLGEMLDGALAVGAAARATRAQDLHDLVKLHEAANVALNAEAVYRSALDRTESREQFYREDFPITDPAWFCWHGVTLADGGAMRFDREPIPLDGARFRPSEPEVGLGAIGAIMQRDVSKGA